MMGETLKCRHHAIDYKTSRLCASSYQTAEILTHLCQPISHWTTVRFCNECPGGRSQHESGSASLGISGLPRPPCCYATEPSRDATKVSVFVSPRLLDRGPANQHSNPPPNATAQFACQMAPWNAAQSGRSALQLLAQLSEGRGQTIAGLV
jgi:hypothetical protein